MSLNVLVTGIYLNNKPNNIIQIVENINYATNWNIKQKWIAIKGEKIPQQLEQFTVSHIHNFIPKFYLINNLLINENLENYEFVIICDGDISFQKNFIDIYLDIVCECNFSLAQPARTKDSYIDHYFVAQMDGIKARETRFVEIGPLFSVRKDIFQDLFPFDIQSPMGWGFDFVWPAVIEKNHKKMGIVDAVAVEHKLRKPVENYNWNDNYIIMNNYLKRNKHINKTEAFKIIKTFPLKQQEKNNININFSINHKILLSVILCTYNRSDLLFQSLNSLTYQTLSKKLFEVVVIDDGSDDNTYEIVKKFVDKLNIKYFFQENSGLASARNHGIYASDGDILYFFDDDDVASKNLLEEHLKTHKQYPKENIAVLNYTTWAPSLKITPLMYFITEVGHFLFSYSNLKNNMELNYQYFWGGRSSCKRNFLLEHGVFNPVFKFGSEDIELGYRLSKNGFKVIYNEKAISYMLRKIDLESFYKRLYKQGYSQYIFSQIHPDEEIINYCDTLNLDYKWKALCENYESQVKSVFRLEKLINSYLDNGFRISNEILKRLYELFWLTFRATKIKGAFDAKNNVVLEKIKN
ncbi:MAG: glycosyltransferase family 2 protein [Candidatus Aenigmatarchaeota archaeon]